MTWQLLTKTVSLAYGLMLILLMLSTASGGEEPMRRQGLPDSSHHFCRWWRILTSRPKQVK